MEQAASCTTQDVFDPPLRRATHDVDSVLTSGGTPLRSLPDLGPTTDQKIRESASAAVRITGAMPFNICGIVIRAEDALALIAATTLPLPSKTGTAMAPKGTPDAVVARINETVTDILKQDDVKSQFERLGVQVELMAVDATAKFIAAERVRWGDIIKSANVTVD